METSGMMKDGISILLASPSSGAPACDDYWEGCIDAARVFGANITNPVSVVGPYVDDARNLLSARFATGVWSHMLMVDRDVGWRAQHLQALLEADKDVISGVYSYKFDGAPPCASMRPGEGMLRQCEWVPGGFLLIKLAAMLQIMSEHTRGRYVVPGEPIVTPVWDLMSQQGGQRARDDVAFSRRALDAGLDLWLHMGVQLPHWGTKAFVGAPPQPPPMEGWAFGDRTRRTPIEAAP